MVDHCKENLSFFILETKRLGFRVVTSLKNYTATFGFRLRGGKGATFFSCPESDTSHFHHVAEVQPQWDQSHLPEWGAPAGKSVPCLPWLPRSAPWAFLQKILVTTSPKQPVTGRVWGSQWNWPFRTDRPRLRWCLLPLPWASKPSKNNHETERSKKSTVELSLLMRSSTLLDRGGTDLQLESSLEPAKRSWGRPSLWAAMWMAATPMTS